MNKARMVLVTLLSVGILTLGTGEAYALSAADILKKVDATATGFKDQRFDMEMTLVAADGKTKVRTFTVWQLGTDKRMVKFTSGDVKGMGVLMDGADSMYVYLPKEGKVRRVGMHSADAAVGTSGDFSNDDMTRITFGVGWTPKLVSEAGGKAVLDLAPKSSKEKWKRLRITVDTKTFYVEQIDYFAKAADIKPARVETRGEMKDVGGKRIASLIVMKNTHTGHRTELRVKKFEVDKGLRDSFFKPRTLMR